MIDGISLDNITNIKRRFIGCSTLTIKDQDIGASTKKICEQMINFDTLDSNK